MRAVPQVRMCSWVIFLHSPFSRACDRREMFAAGLELPALGGLVLLQCLVEPEPPAEPRPSLVPRLLDHRSSEQRERGDGEDDGEGDIGCGGHKHSSLHVRCAYISRALVFACDFRSSSKACL